MTLVALLLSLFVALVGALGVVSPAALLGLVRRFQTSRGLYFAAALRVVLGVALFFAAPTSRAPGLLRLLSVIIIVAGLATPFFGLDRFRRLLDWWSARGPAFIRAWAGFAFAFGLWLVYVLIA